MTADIPGHVLRSFVLGTLPERDAAAIEERIFDDDAAFDAVLDTEYELLDAYAAGTLDERERTLVESRLLPVLGAGALRTARTLHARAGRAPASTAASLRRARRPAWSALAAAAALVAAAGSAIVWFVASSGGAEEAARMTLVLERTAPPARITTPDAPRLPSDATVHLDPRMTRGTRIAEVTIPGGTDVVRVRLPVPDSTRGYRVQVNGLPTTAPLHFDRRSPGGWIELWLPTAQIATRTLEFVVSEDDGSDAALLAVFPARFSVARAD